MGGFCSMLCGTHAESATSSLGCTKTRCFVRGSSISVFVVTQSSFGEGRKTSPTRIGTRLKENDWANVGGSRKWKSFSPQKRKASFSEKGSLSARNSLL